jgi:hypothetical protein
MNRRAAGICLIGFALLLYGLGLHFAATAPYGGVGIDEKLILIVGGVGFAYLVVAEWNDRGRSKP